MLPWGTCDSKVPKEPFQRPKLRSPGGSDNLPLNAGINTSSSPLCHGCGLHDLPIFFFRKRWRWSVVAVDAHEAVHRGGGRKWGCRMPSEGRLQRCPRKTSWPSYAFGCLVANQPLAEAAVEQGECAGKRARSFARGAACSHWTAKF